MIEIHLDGKPVTRLQAARALAEVGSGQQVRIGEPKDKGWIADDITVYGRRYAYGANQPPELGCMSFHAKDPAEMRQQAEMIMIAAEVAELAAEIGAEMDASAAAEPAEHDETADPDRQKTVSRAIALIDEADPADLRRYIAATSARDHLKADPDAFRAALTATWSSTRASFGTWKIAQQLLHAAGLPH